MNNQNLVIYDFQIIFEILYEIENKLNFKILNIDKENLKDLSYFKDKNFILLTKKIFQIFIIK